MADTNGMIAPLLFLLALRPSPALLAELADLLERFEPVVKA